jgi:hypothetical protein
MTQFIGFGVGNACVSDRPEKNLFTTASEVLFSVSVVLILFS